MYGRSAVHVHLYSSPQILHDGVGLDVLAIRESDLVEHELKESVCLHAFALGGYVKDMAAQMRSDGHHNRRPILYLLNYFGFHYIADMACSRVNFALQLDTKAGSSRKIGLRY